MFFSCSKFIEKTKISGCGKTLIAKATAKEAGMRFINLDVAMLTEKWYGESEKLATAVFTLARKIQPCIIFIDEMDSFLRARNARDNETNAIMKTLFMMLWDGLSTDRNSTVIVMGMICCYIFDNPSAPSDSVARRFNTSFDVIFPGATNRPQDIDTAILRRMPVQFHIDLPAEEQRKQILELVLGTEAVGDDVDFNRLADLTDGFSGSDLHELCRHATIYRIREFMRRTDNVDSIDYGGETKELDGLSAISMHDLIRSSEQMRESKMRTQTERQAFQPDYLNIRVIVCNFGL